MKRIILPLLFVSVVISGCFSVKPGSGTPGTKHYQTFYIGEAGIQYFIKPLEFTSGDESVIVDFTFRYKDSVQGFATANYSIWSKEKIRKSNGLALVHGNETYHADSLDLMFRKTVRSYFVSRYSCKIPVREFVTFMNGNEWAIKTSYEGEDHLFMPSGKTKKTIPKLQQSVFAIIQ